MNKDVMKSFYYVVTMFQLQDGEHCELCILYPELQLSGQNIFDTVNLTVHKGYLTPTEITAMKCSELNHLCGL